MENSMRRVAYAGGAGKALSPYGGTLSPRQSRRLKKKGMPPALERRARYGAQLDQARDARAAGMRIAEQTGGVVATPEQRKRLAIRRGRGQ